MDADTAQKDAEFNDKISVSGHFTLKRQACKPQVAEDSIDDGSEDIVEDDVLARFDDGKNKLGTHCHCSQLVK